GLPALGFSFIDVRDVAALEVGALTASDAAGQRLIAAGRFLWLSDVAAILRERLGAHARKVPRPRAPDAVGRPLGPFAPEVRSVTGDLGEKTIYSMENAERRVGWAPRPVEETIVECARSLLGRSASTPAASPA